MQGLFLVIILLFIVKIIGEWSEEFETRFGAEIFRDAFDDAEVQ